MWFSVVQRRRGCKQQSHEILLHQCALFSHTLDVKFELSLFSLSAPKSKLCSSEEVQYRRRGGIRLLQMTAVAALLKICHCGVRQRLSELRGGLGRQNLVMAAPQHQYRRLHCADPCADACVSSNRDQSHAARGNETSPCMQPGARLMMPHNSSSE